MLFRSARLHQHAARDGTESEPGRPRIGRAARDEEAISALVNLGYKRGDAEKVLREIPPEVRLEDAIREALRRFAR